ncbi:hypothetical protein V1511DRAFT_505850 [Dipodascopsis uninucleata]
MTDKLPPPLLALFAPRPPLRYLLPTDVAPENRHTARISGVAKFVELLNTPDPNYIPVETKAEENLRRKLERAQDHEERLKEGLRNWNPKEDPHIRGDPFTTLFVSRLTYDTTEDDLENEFRRYGSIERVRVVRDKDTGKSRGYGFIVFAREGDMRAAYKEMNGAKIKNRKITVDVERGRTVKSWKPRWLGGGLGGRHYTKAAILKASKDYHERDRDRGRDRDRERYRGASGGGKRDWDRDRDRDRYGDRYRRDDRDRDRDRRDREHDRDRDRDRRNDRYRREDGDRWSKRPRYS